MSFFRENQQLDVLNITGAYEAGTQVLEPIRLLNNSELKLNLTGLTVNPSNKELKNPEQITTLKIVIDWGDGNTESLSPIFEVKNSTINTVYEPWTVTSHNYSLKSENNNLSLVISVYNTMNDCLVIDIPVIIEFQSLLESCAKLNLVSANITNDNKVSYVINNSTEESNFVVSSVE